MSPQDDVYFIDADPTSVKRPGSQGEGRKVSRFWRRGGVSRARQADTTLGRETGGRRPLLAASLSLLLCGAGQIYNGRRDLALLYFLTEALAASLDWCAWRLWEPIVKLLHVFFIERLDLMAVVAIGNYAFALFVISTVLQAYRDAAGGAGGEALRLPVASSLASLLVPGWGQILNAQPRKGALLMGMFMTGAYAFGVSMALPPLWQLWDRSYQMIFGLTLTNGGVAALTVAVVVYIAAFYDALLVARRQRSQAL